MKKVINKFITVMCAIMMLLVITPFNETQAEGQTISLSSITREFTEVHAGDTLVNDFVGIDADIYFSYPKTTIESGNSDVVPMDGLLYFGYTLSDSYIFYFYPKVNITIKNSNDPKGSFSDTVLVLYGDSVWSIDEITDELNIDGTKYKPSNIQENYNYYWNVTYSNGNPVSETSGVCNDNYTFEIAYYTPSIEKLEVNAYSDGLVGQQTDFQILLLDEHGKYLTDNTKTMILAECDSTGTITTDNIDSVASPLDGYSLSYTPTIKGNHYLKFYIDGSSVSKTIVFNVKQNESSILLNKGWPYGTDFDVETPEAKLKIDVNDEVEYDSISYQWFSTVPGKSNVDVNYTAISGANSNQLVVNSEDNYKWFRCEVTATKDLTDTVETSNAVLVFEVDEYGEIEVVDDGGDGDTVEISCSSVCPGLYISNSNAAYCLGDITDITRDSNPYSLDAPFEFNILGLWNGNWIHTSFDYGWSIYTKEVNSDTQIVNNIKSIVASFEDYDSNNVVFDVKFKENCDAAVFTDVCIGSDELFGDYADYAAVKANFNGNKLSTIQMLASKNFVSSTSSTCAFVFTPITETSIFDIDSLCNGDDNYQYDCTDSIVDYSELEDYEESFNAMLPLIFNYNTCILDGYYEMYDTSFNPFVRKTVNGIQNVCYAMYGDDSVLAVDWKNVDEIKYMFGVGKARSFDGITFTEAEDEIITPNSSGGGHHNYVEVLNTGIN